MATGAALVGIGALSAHGSTYGPLHHDYRMGRTVGSSTPAENYEREIKDKNRSYGTLIMLFVAGSVPIAIGVLLTMIKH